MRVVLVLLAFACQAQQKPAGLSVSTWVREDIFAGFLTGDMPQFEKGMVKLEDLLAANPDSPDALAWRGGGKLLLAARAHEAGDAAAFQRHYSEAQADFTKSAAEAAKHPDFLAAAHAIRGGSYAVMADRLPKANVKPAGARFARATWRFATRRRPSLTGCPCICAANCWRAWPRRRNGSATWTRPSNG